ncbi:autotransporter outer membrane beta-barrel domain-containing protein [Erwinia amylovora]
MNVKNIFLFISLNMTICSIQVNASTHYDASGNSVADNAILSESQVAYNYDEVFSNSCTDDNICLYSSDSSPYKFSKNWDLNTFSFINPLTSHKTETINGVQATQSDGGNNYNVEFNSHNGSVAHYYEGDKVSSADFKVSGQDAYLIIYRNYAAGAKVTAEDGASLFAEGNNVAGAELNLNNASSWLLGNIATSANIYNTGGGYSLIKSNDAGDVKIENSGSTMILDSNYAEGGVIINTDGGNLTAYNNVNNAQIEASGERSVTTLENNNARQARIQNSGLISMNNNQAEEVVIVNQGVADINKNYATGASITNHGTLYASENNISSGEVTNDGDAGFLRNTISDAKVINSGNISIVANTGTESAVTNNAGGYAILDGNILKASTITNKGTMVWGCENADDCSEYSDSQLTDSTFNNGGSLTIRGTTDFSNSTLENFSSVFLDAANISHGVIKNDGDLYLISSSTLSTLENTGNVILNPCSTCAGEVLTVNGDWYGNKGSVSFGTVLGNDNSLTDKLVITGNASGTTYVTVANEGGSGAQTLEGIELIATGSSTSDAFIQKGRIVAGSYEYYLQQGTATGADKNNWYLTSLNSDNGYNGNGSGSGNGQLTYRPERGSYVSNLQAASTLFNSRLKDRQGAALYTDPVTGEQDKSRLWLRSVGGHNQGHLSDGQSKYAANRVVLQIGGGCFVGKPEHSGFMASWGDGWLW